MAQSSKYFGKLFVTVDCDLDRSEPNDEPVSGCWIEQRDRQYRYTASLAALQDTGVLESIEGYVIEIEPAVIDDIEAWAIENGY